ncbi:type III toxin-antitoxin system TenpIN family toxin [Aeromonas veronii]|uniref:type III toxin-antitoxin system TenpIN family toxin n=1 Tax=Aeromonas veronii TaxID=654 RepID=UPI001D0A1CB8|nr:hypothetical protein [Aeromonas veronii]MCC0088609.1 hypothetical protein [Aeromonas veronii]
MIAFNLDTKMIAIRTLTPDFHTSNPDLTEGLADKGRGYGIVAITINGLTFGVPLRTNLNHPHGVVLDTIVKGGKKCKRGLDFTKALLIADPTNHIGGTFQVSPAQLAKLRSHHHYICEKFEKYVERYVDAVKTGKDNTIRGSGPYQYSTLVNYHAQLGI